MSKRPIWTRDELVEFDLLVEKASSPHQMDRIEARMDMPEFITKHGKDKCDAMFAHLEAGGDIADGPLIESEDGEGQS